MVLWRPLRDLGLFALTASVLLGTVHAVVEFRLRQAAQTGRATRYVAHADPWLPVAVLVGGASAILLLQLIAG